MSHPHPPHPPHAPHAGPPLTGFGADRAAHYDAQASVSLAGYTAAYELGACALAARLEGREAASLLFVGLGTGAELVPFQRLGVPGWRFTGVDPSDAMLAVARERLQKEGLLARAQLHVGELPTLPEGPPFDGAQMMGVLHHVDGEEARLALLREVARRLAPDAPLVLGCRVGTDPELTDVELRRLRAYGISPEMLAHRRQHAGAMRPIASDEALFALLAQAGLAAPRLLFASLQYKVFLTRRAPGAAR
jgi:tRNA (cmo5U34)-methyltransferase